MHEPEKGVRLTRRGAMSRLLAIGAGGAISISGLASCRRASPEGEVSLYSSVDEPLLREVMDVYAREHSGRVLLVGDTEATKTTGLLQRLVAERENPRCDVWWSNEAFSTIGLARQGMLEPLSIASELRSIGWPLELIGAGDQWVGFAQRARVIVYNTARVSRDAAPTSLSELLREEFRGRVGMARPQFGTTRGHMAALVAAHGGERTRAYLAALKGHGLRIYDGNSLIVRAVAQGEIDVGLTDTDDVFAGQRNGWPVEFTLERADDPGIGSEMIPSIGPLVIPNTVARIKNGPESRRGGGVGGADALVAFLLSEKHERLLAASEARNIPVRPGLASKVETVSIARPMAVRLEDVESRIDEALAIVAETLGV
ncbi:MAG: extracellular solute-binding protein [Phycisphaeraceae bacterium]|nr:extracellular solute-binding protein [Phycisphaeraceae bacterium]MBX3368195.1 extracellular solute-binding protein [Phycisphaeraceae bacterium]